MAALQPPLATISPLIKFARWSSLIAGIMWGIHRHRTNNRTEKAFQEYEAKQKPIRDAKLAVEKKRLLREELLYIAKESGIPIPKDFNEKY